MDVLLGDVAEIYFINACAVLDVMRHAWLCHQIVHGQLPVCVQFLFECDFPERPRCRFTSRTLCTTSNSRGLPPIP